MSWITSFTRVSPVDPQVLGILVKDLKFAEAKIERLIKAGDAMMKAGDETGTPVANKVFMDTVHAWEAVKR